MAQPKMTPMIDVVFQMLIFFMVAMQIRDPEGILRANLPKNGNGTISPREVRIRLTKSPPADQANGAEIRIMFEQYRCQDMDDLGAKLKQLKGYIPDLDIVIDGAPEVPFDYVIRTIDACKAANYTKIQFTRPPLPDLHGERRPALAD